MNYETLKRRHRAERDGYPQATSLRLHRALSWLDRSEQCAGDEDAQFIFLWIAFNAAYATAFVDEPDRAERRRFHAFVAQLVTLDARSRIAALLWHEFAASIRGLLSNQYVFPDFWRHQSGALTDAVWRERLAAGRRKANQMLQRSDVRGLLMLVLQRIYTLRNQLVHGGATWGGKVNREQVRDCTRLMARLVPVIIELMMDHPAANWGEVAYPVVSDTGNPASPAQKATHAQRQP